MNILEELEDFINTFNQNQEEEFEIDTIRIEFSKQNKLEQIREVGIWKKVQNNSNILHKLKKRLENDEVTSAYRLSKHNIYYYNMQDKPKYRKACLVIFGMKQYHKEAPPRNIIIQLLSILKDVTNIDVCIDFHHQPTLLNLNKLYSLKQYITNNGVATDTHYINKTDIPMLEKITIYNKALKNNLKDVLWRIEAKISIPNTRLLALPLNEFKSIVDLTRTT